MAKILVLVLPPAAALTLPVAALFSAAAAYGRMSADNEFVACRSSGINLNILFLPALALSVGSALITFCLIGFVIPSMLRNLSDFLAEDVPILLQQKLENPTGLNLPGYRLFARRSAVESGETDRVILEGVSFIQVSDEQWSRYGTAEALYAEFENTDDEMQVAAKLVGLSLFDREAGRFIDLAEQPIAVSRPPLGRIEIKFLNLLELWHYFRRPGEWREVESGMTQLRLASARRLVNDRILSDWAADKTFELADADARYVVQAQHAVEVPRDGEIELQGVTIREYRGGKERVFTAARGVVAAGQARSLKEASLHLDAYDATTRDGENVLRRTKESFQPVRVPPEVVAQVEGLSNEQLLAAPAGAASHDDFVSKRREAALDAAGKTVRAVAATLHERFAFSLSVLVLVVLAAALGVHLRGAHLMVAFGISFIPSLVVILSIVAGKQMAQNAGTYLGGLAMMWAGLGVVIVLDWLTLTRWLRR
jgi:lipopolysaccharide export LptBFGC system permease protein LptF